MKPVSAFITNIWDDFSALLFPLICVNCRKVLLTNEYHICTKCQIALPVTNYHKRLNDNPVYNDLKIMENLQGAAAYLKYNKHGVAQNVLYKLKYKGGYTLGVHFGRLYGSHLVDCINVDCIVPVPIHPKKLNKRGYNQCMAIAEGLQQYLEIPIYSDAISRVKQTATQTKNDKVDRWRAMTDVFAVKDHEILAGKRVLLVDDVITTGATMYALSCAIDLCQPTSITVVALASGK
ncbi:MAG: ComF family protein [Cyclobacteriaceae bacterium]|jgi:ComF family protein